MAFRTAAAGLALVVTAAVAAPARLPAVASRIGTASLYTARDEDTLLDIARLHDIGYVEIRIANPHLDPWKPGVGALVTIPGQHLIPDAPHRGIVINLPELRLYYFSPAAAQPLSFPIGVGDEGKETPLGPSRIRAKTRNPVWVPTPGEHREDPDLPSRVPSGPDNPMGYYALYVDIPGIAIHGTNKPDSIGRRDSHGCIRLYPEDIEKLYGLVKPGTSVTIVDQPFKLAWIDEVLYLEVHPELSDINAIEAGDPPVAPPSLDADERILDAVHGDHDLVDWDAVLAAELERSGMPIPITRRSQLVMPR